MSIQAAQDTLISMANSAAEPVRAVIIDASAGDIKSIIIEKMSKTTPVKTALVVVGAAAVVTAAGYGAFKLYKKRKASKAAKATAGK